MRLEIHSDDELYRRFHKIGTQEARVPVTKDSCGLILLFDDVDISYMGICLDYAEAKVIKKVVDEIIQAYEGLE